MRTILTFPKFSTKAIIIVLVCILTLNVIYESSKMIQFKQGKETVKLSSERFNQYIDLLYTIDGSFEYTETALFKSEEIYVFGLKDNFRKVFYLAYGILFSILISYSGISKSAENEKTEFNNL